MVAWGRVIMSMAATDYRPVRLIGLGCLVVTAFGWGLNWPATKFLLEQCPPLTARGIAGLVAGLALAGIALARGENADGTAQASVAACGIRIAQRQRLDGAYDFVAALAERG